MRRIAYSKFLLPPGPGRRSPYVSGWKMSAAEAAARGAVGIVPGTTEIREEPETEDERRQAQFAYPSAGRDKTT